MEQEMIVYRPVSRIIAVITIAAMMITAFTGIAPQNAYAATEVPYEVTGGNIYFDKDTGTVTRCDDTVTDVVIPEEIEGVTVRVIGSSAFSWKKSLKSVIMADSIVSIMRGAFSYCTELESVKLPLNLKGIGVDAFRNCENLKQTEFPPNLESIYYGAFAGCVFPEINIPDSLATIEGWGLICTDMTEITLPKGMRILRRAPFSGFKSLKNIYVESGNSCFKSVDGVLYSANNDCIYAYPQARTEESYEILYGTQTIEQYAFYNTGNLKNISMPDTVTDIENYAFLNSGITSVEISDKVEYIREGTFSKCRNLKEIKFPAALNSIVAYAFDYSTSIEEITIPDGALSISIAAFSNIDALKKVTLPASLTFISDEAFRSCKNFKTRDLVVIAPEGSYAYNWAVKNNLLVKAADASQLTQAIICDSKFNKKLGCQPFNLGATAKTALTYSSSNPAVADISSDGTVTVKGDGTAVITVTAAETLIYKSAVKEITVNVIKPAEQKIGGADSFTKLTTDSSFNLNATAEGKLSYASGNSGVVSVSGDGTVKIIGAGKTTITVYAAESDKYNAASKKVTVTVNKAEQTIKAADSFVKELKDGFFNLNATAEGALSYSSNNTSVADVSSAGVVSLKGFGSTVITITAAETDKYKTAVKKVNVTVNKPPQTILGADSFTREFGCGPFGLGASAEGALSYESSNNNIVTVSSSGVVTVKSAGTAVITVIAAETDKYARTTKSVLINIKKDDQDIGGDIAFYKTYGCEPFDLGIIAQGKCTFTSSNVRVASVSDKGIVTVNGAGVAVITITSAETGNYNEAVKTVTVTVEKAAQTIQCKKSISKTFSFETFNIGVISATDCIYQSSNEKLVTVNEFGDVTLKNPGKVTVTITAVESDNYRSAVKKITISSKLKKPVIKVKALKGGKAKLSWDSVSGAKGYKVYIYDKAKKKYVHRLTKRASVKSVIHRGLKKGVTYKYKIRAYRKVNGKTVYSPYSAVKSVRAR